MPFCPYVLVPFGVCIYQLKISPDNEGSRKQFPSPFRGLYINKSHQLQEQLKQCFRPLFEVSIYQFIRLTYIFNYYEFPSPLRGLYISIESKHMIIVIEKVSVPSSGSLYINGDLTYIYVHNLSFPSPLRGLYISILSSASLIFSGLQSQTTAQNHIWLIASRNLIAKYSEHQYFRLSAQKLTNPLFFFI